MARARVRLRIIGDVHGKVEQYQRLTEGVDYSIQVGDMGYGDAYSKISDLSICHRFIKGNHDDYDNETPRALGDFGVHAVPNFSDIFFVRGAWSIDQRIRQQWEREGRGKHWWPDEELSWEKLETAHRLYNDVKPHFVISHDCPESIKLELTDPAVAKHFGWGENPKTRTALALQAMFEDHQPHYWFFGHYHKSFDKVRNGTRFICLNELEFFDFKKRLVT